jgi:hypothetical protein
MKKIIMIGVSGLIFFSCSGQNNRLFLRHDTILLNPNEAVWLVNDAGVNPGKSVPALILDAIVAGKLKARDPQTMEIIPAGKILTWRQASDTTMVWDEKKQDHVIKVIQHTLKPENISGIRVYYDWFLDTSSGKIYNEMRSVELMQEVNSYEGIFRGYRVFCKLE